MNEQQSAEGPLAVIFAALADETRLRLVGLLARQDLCVCDLVETLHDAQPKISRHLTYLRHAGIVMTERRGKWIRYSLRDPLPRAIAVLLPLLRVDSAVQTHHTKQCCPQVDAPCVVSTDSPAKRRR